MGVGKSLAYAPNVMFSLIMSLWSVSIATINAFKVDAMNVNGDTEDERFTQGPYVKVELIHCTRNFLYDTGASRTCMRLSTFNKIFQMVTQENWLLVLYHLICKTQVEIH